MTLLLAHQISGNYFRFWWKRKYFFSNSSDFQKFSKFSYGTTTKHVEFLNDLTLSEFMHVFPITWKVWTKWKIVTILLMKAQLDLNLKNINAKWNQNTPDWIENKPHCPHDSKNKKIHDLATIHLWRPHRREVEGSWNLSLVCRFCCF